MAWAELLKGVAVETHLEKVLHVEAHRLHVEVEQVDRVIQQEDNEHEEHPSGEANFGDPPNSVSDARKNRARCNCCDCPDDNKLGCRRDRNGRLKIEIFKPFWRQIFGKI